MDNFTTVTGVNFIFLPTPIATTATTLGTCTLKPLTVITTAAVNKPKFTSTPPLKPAKKFRDEQEEILRCKRRLDFASLGLHSLQRNSRNVGVLRRNERERNRVKLINNTFARLQAHLPVSETTSKGKAKKLSKVDTLKNAIDYIRNLQEMLDDHDAVSAAFQSGYISPDMPSELSPSDSAGLPVAAASPSSSCGSPEQSISDHGDAEPPLSPEEEDLLDFASWFQ